MKSCRSGVPPHGVLAESNGSLSHNEKYSYVSETIDGERYDDPLEFDESFNWRV